MKSLVAVTLVLFGLTAVASEAHAVGCISGGVVGGVAGHAAGHHGLLGAAAGCAVGHHYGKRQRQERQMQTQPQDTNNGR